MSVSVNDGGRLEGKVALVTGGASGIGLAIVERFIACGASVVFCDLEPRTGRDLETSIGPTAARLHHRRRVDGGPNDGYAIAERLADHAHFTPADVTDADAFAAAVETAVQRFGGLDILVNNAGVGGGEVSIEHCPAEIFDRTIAVNLRAVWIGMKLAFPHLRRRGGGSIINVASVSALRAMPGQGAYGASKAGVVQLTRVAAMEGAPNLIRANAICPGAMLTEIIYDSPFFDFRLPAAAVEDQLSKAQPLPRAGRPDDIAGTALWLASDDASFVTGQSIVVDGGLSVEFDARQRANQSRPG